MFIKSLRSDRGGEFLSKNFNHFCKEHGIHRELTTPYTPEQNGVAERKNRTVVEMARSMLQMKSLSNDFWAEAVSTSIYLLNISPKVVMNKTPFEVCWDWKNNEEYVSLVDGELTNDGEQTEFESLMETPTSTPLSSTSSTLQSYHSSSSNDETSDELPSQRFRPMEDIYNSSQFTLMVSDPVSYDEAASKEEWQQAMKEEMAAIEKNGTWKMVDLPEGKNAIGLKWVYKSKFIVNGSLEKHKARLVAKGYAQQHGIDFEETFSPVARFETVRIVLALAAQQQWPVYQFDVKSAFLNGELEEEFCVEQPEGFVKKDSEEKVYKLTKALYGLKQAPRACSSKSLVAEFKSHMKNKFEMTDLGLLHFFLGLEVCQTDGGIFISQKKYVKDLLKKFGMINCKPAITPMNVNEKLQQNDGAEMANAQLFRSLVGGFIYLTHTRPNISYSIGVIFMFMQRPSKDHFGAAKRVMRYIAGTIQYGIWYSKVSDFKLCGFTDNDWASSLDDRRSVSANVFTLGSGVIAWSSKKQATVALSSSEAEYVAATSATCQAIWLRRMLTKLQHEQD
ncbi:integrase [Cucumis melo var. makuwa]|uniref:Integrase n=1 Tax=Cucumis melo var. makuwa TaxID=1194695 RepID=A0A5A7V1M6_CUCMM|nr:integrase [Cucumis melo var. makuwa]TYJ99778.1 integrase [Cucumis melo var. makuwa]